MDAALEWAEYKALLCSGCGHLKSESMDPAMARAYEAVPLTCHACAAAAAENRNVANTKSAGRYSDSAFDGLYVAVQKNEG